MKTHHLRRTLALVLLSAVAVACAFNAQAQTDKTIHPVYLTDADLAEVKRLVADGADVNAKNIGGGTALHHLITVSAQMGMDGLMIVNKKIISPGQWSATGHEAIAQFLVGEGAKINAQDGTGMTPLHVAALTGHSAAVKFLVALGADVNAKDADGHTPMYWAKWSATTQAIKELAAATGARINPGGVKRRAAKVVDALKQAGASSED
jgi:ankyrin repeat protein